MDAFGWATAYEMPSGYDMPTMDYGYGLNDPYGMNYGNPFGAFMSPYERGMGMNMGMSTGLNGGLSTGLGAGMSGLGAHQMQSLYHSAPMPDTFAGATYGQPLASMFQQAPQRVEVPQPPQGPPATSTNLTPYQPQRPTSMDAALAPRSTPQTQAGASVVVTGYATAEADDESRARVVDIIRKLQEESRKSPGCIQYHWTESLEEAGVFRIYEEWESDAHLQMNLDSEHVKEFKEAVPDLFSDDPVVQKACVMPWEAI